MVSATSEFFSDFRSSGGFSDSGTGRERIKVSGKRAEGKEEISKVLIVCPRCGTGNQEGSVKCKSCGEAI